MVTLPTIILLCAVVAAFAVLYKQSNQEASELLSYRTDRLEPNIADGTEQTTGGGASGGITTGSGIGGSGEKKQSEGASGEPSYPDKPEGVSDLDWDVFRVQNQLRTNPASFIPYLENQL